MWIVRLALRRPYTFVVMAIAIVLLGVFAILRTPTDIFPEVDIPVISVIWRYDGMSPEEMESALAYYNHHRRDIDARLLLNSA